MTYIKGRAYNNLPLLPLEIDLETKAVLRKTNTANKALAELKGHLSKLPNPMLVLQALLVQEAQSSSAIENVVTTNDALFQALLSPNDKNITASTKEVLHYKEALWHGFQKTLAQYPLTINVFIELFRIVKQRSDGIRPGAGTVLQNPVSKEMVYIPPDNQDDILRLLSNLEKYINDPSVQDIDPLIKLAVIHYQFECIHPFPDGNGRVGRILNVLYLIQEELLSYPVLYLSKYIITHKQEYYSTLKKVTEENIWEDWILYMLSAIEETAIQTLKIAKDIDSAKEIFSTLLRDETNRTWPQNLVDVIFSQPYCKISTLVKNNIAKTQTASVYLRELEAIGLLRCEKHGREKYYINNKLWSIVMND